jgi:hypothetical protein
VIFDRIIANKTAIEAKLGEVGWERLDHRRASRIALYHAGSIDDPPQKLTALRVWGVDSLTRLNAVLEPLLEEANR